MYIILTLQKNIIKKINTLKIIIFISLNLFSMPTFDAIKR